MKDIKEQELFIGDIVCYRESYRLSIGVITKINPKSIYVIQDNNSAYLPLIKNTNFNTLKLPPTLENRELFLKDLNLSSEVKQEILDLFKQNDKLNEQNNG